MIRCVPGVLGVLVPLMARCAPPISLPPSGGSISSVPIQRLAHRFDASWRWLPNGDIILLTPHASIRFDGDGRRVFINGTLVILQRPCRAPRQPTVLVDRLDVEYLIEPLLRPGLRLQVRPVRCVVLDPGHGGRDGGAIGRDGALEKHLTLDLATRTRRHLMMAGFHVILTRERDEFVALEDRVLLARRHAAEVFVSLHFNAAREADASGVETYVFVPEHTGARIVPAEAHRAAASVALAYSIQRQVTGATRRVDRGVRTSRFAVLRMTDAPAVLFEGGFLTHPEESRWLGKPTSRDELARVLARAIQEYADQVERAHWIRGGYSLR